LRESTAHQHHEIADPPLTDLPFEFKMLPRWILLAGIRTYQIIISPAIPADTCRFYPTCSHFAYQAVYRHGALKGGWMAFTRVLRCNPFNPGGFDPVPQGSTGKKKV
jgi:hypothetical protein